MRMIAINERGELDAAEIHPPPGIAAALAATRDLYAREGYRRPWISYVAADDHGCAGLGAFKSPPKGGKVEIAYMTLPEREGEGCATRIARELVRLARAELPEIDIRAQTLREENASVAILKKLGFRFAGDVLHPEDGPVWEWTLSPPT
jgi:RimJ/RimL family protein N-acetyltransferase